MTSLRKDHSGSTDLFSLANAPMAVLIEALEEDRTLADTGGGLPPRAEQIAELIVAEAVRLIRLGARTELVEAAMALAQAVVGPVADELERLHPDAYRLVDAASVTLGAAASPSSGGGELAVLRAWKGKALKVVAALNESSERAMRRAELRKRLGGVKHSHMSHLLADLEAANLIVRVRDGKEVTVQLGPSAETEHVRQMLPARPQRTIWTRFEKAGNPQAVWFGYQYAPRLNREDSGLREFDLGRHRWGVDKIPPGSEAKEATVPLAGFFTQSTSECEPHPPVLAVSRGELAAQ